MFWKRRERDCVAPAPLLPPGSRRWGVGAGARGMGPAWSQAQQSFRTSPPPPARTDSPGDFHPLPKLCSSQMLQTPGAEPTASSVARHRCGTWGAAEVGNPLTPMSSGNIEAGHLAGRRGVPKPTCGCGDTVLVYGERERRCGPSSLECGYRTFHRQIRRLRLWPKGGGGSCRRFLGIWASPSREDGQQTRGASSLLCCLGLEPPPSLAHWSLICFSLVG